MSIPLYALIAGKPVDPEAAYHIQRTWRQIRQGEPQSQAPEPEKKPEAPAE